MRRIDIWATNSAFCNVILPIPSVLGVIWGFMQVIDLIKGVFV